MQAFCACYFRSIGPSQQSDPLYVRHSPRALTTPYALAVPKSSRNKRPRPDRKSSGFGDNERPASRQNLSQTSKSSASPTSFGKNENDASVETDDAENGEARRQKELQKVDGNGISLEHRLREEILHPLRKPKQTLFATLAFSATLGFFIACGRLATARDTPTEVFTNISVDISAIALFAFLTWREFEFGRRSLNSIAGRPQPRDLPVVSINQSRVPRFRLRLPFRSSTSDTGVSTSRLASLLSNADILIVAGRGNDIRKYLDRCVESSNYQSNDPPSVYNNKHPSLVAFAIDGRESSNGSYAGATAVASQDNGKAADWINWLGDAVPPRRNVALFKIDARSNATEPARTYVVTIEDPLVAPLPADAKRHVIIEV